MCANYEIRVIFDGLELLEDKDEDGYEDNCKYDDDDDDFFDEVSAEEILALLRKLQMSRK